jgi:hypothetical protein
VRRAANATLDDRVSLSVITVPPSPVRVRDAWVSDPDIRAMCDT